jgi:hypothetical protein
VASCRERASTRLGSARHGTRLPHRNDVTMCERASPRGLTSEGSATSKLVGIRGQETSDEGRGSPADRCLGNRSRKHHANDWKPVRKPVHGPRRGFLESEKPPPASGPQRTLEIKTEAPIPRACAKSRGNANPPSLRGPASRNDQVSGEKNGPSSPR